jgi:release factor glutamine methyltransferase
MLYSPEEDSFLLEKEVKKYLSSLTKEQKSKINILDMGSGSGIQAKACITSGIKKQNILCADIDKETIKYLKKQKLKKIQSNLFSNINKESKFDLIIFNPPYLPEDKQDKGLDTTGGKEGHETIIKFLQEAKEHLAKKGKILLLVSSLSKPRIIKKEIKRLNYKKTKLSELKTFFEKLEIWDIK